MINLSRYFLSVYVMQWECEVRILWPKTNLFWKKLLVFGTKHLHIWYKSSLITKMDLILFFPLLYDVGVVEDNYCLIIIKDRKAIYVNGRLYIVDTLGSSSEVFVNSIYSKMVLLIARCWSPLFLQKQFQVLPSYWM